MQTPPNYQQQYPAAYQPYQPQKTGGGSSVLAIIALIIAILALALTVVLNLLGTGGGVNPKFEVEDFDITKTESDYTYSTYVYFDGEGTVTTSDTKNSYIVVLKCTLTSGGGDYSEEEFTRLIQVVDGEGTFYTYDSGYEGSITKPKYDFEVVGYVKLNN
jgi:hypothetical protein